VGKQNRAESCLANESVGRVSPLSQERRKWYNSYIKMRVQLDAVKNREVQRKHGVSLEEAREIFDQAYVVDAKVDDPEQFRAIGWSRGRLCSVIFEMRRDSDGEYYHLVTAWKATKQEIQAYAEQV
jgi:uncharacterized DUF497 family protein